MALTHPERVIDTISGATKGDVAAYYARVAAWLLPELKGRPVALLRAPEGVGGEAFFQKHPGRSAISGTTALDADLWPGHQPLMALTTPAALQGAVQMNTLEFHAWNARNRQLDKPDRMVFDLDPGEGVPWAAICEGAELVRQQLGALGLQAGLKTSGGRGLHLVVPLMARWPTATVRGFSQAVVQQLVDGHPDRFVGRSGAEQRVGRIFVDYLRNGEGATTVAAYSLRARPGLGVSMPLGWDELPAVAGPTQWTLATTPGYLDQRAADPWAELRTLRQSLSAPMQRLGWRPA